MTPREAAAALLDAMPTGPSLSQLEEYGIEATAERARAIARELLSLNLFWIFSAIEAHIPAKFQPAVSELVLKTMESGWGTSYPVGAVAWTAFLAEWKERTQRYERFVREGLSPLAVTAESGLFLEERQVVTEEERRNVLTLLIDFVPVEAYGQLLQDVH